MERLSQFLKTATILGVLFIIFDLTNYSINAKIWFFILIAFYIIIQYLGYRASKNAAKYYELAYRNQGLLYGIIQIIMQFIFVVWGVYAICN